MSLADIVQVTITSSGRGVSRKGFGIPMVLAKHSNFAGLTKQYNLGTAVADMIVDGFISFDPAVRAVAALARNTPKPSKVIVGKLLTAFDQTFDLTVKTIVAVGGELYSMIITSPDGTATTVSYTASPGDTETVIAAALDALIDAITDLSSTPTLGVMAVSADNPSEMFFVNGLDIELMDFLETTIDSNLVAELTAIQASNSTWYGLILADPQSNARIVALANYVETQEKIFLSTTHDTATGDPVSTTDVAYLTKAAQLFRTSLIYSGNQGAHAGATWMGNGFPFDPGSQTWAFKPLSGVVVDSLASGFQTALDDKSCNYYVEIGGLPVTNGGESTGGTMASGEYIDVIRGRDWTVARLRERIFGLLANARKIPYTQGGADQIGSEVDAQMREGISAGYLSPDPLEGADVPFIVTVPVVAEVAKADKNARLLPDVAFEATLAGAIHATRLNGSISV